MIRVLKRAVPMNNDSPRPHLEEMGLRATNLSPQRDLCRRAVHILLIIYLSPAILAVLLVGGIAVLFDGLVRVLVRFTRGFLGRLRGQSLAASVVGKEDLQPCGPLATGNPSDSEREDMRFIAHDLASASSHRGD